MEELNPPPTNPTKAVVLVGVDVGAESTKVVLGEGSGYEIVRNDVGGHTTPTMIALGETTKQPRQLGTQVSNKKHAVYHLNRLLDGELPRAPSETTQQSTIGEEEQDLMQPFYPFSVTAEGTVENVHQHGSSKSFSNAALIGMLLGKIKESALATWRRRQPASSSTTPVSASEDASDRESVEISMALSCPADMTANAQQQLVDAAYAAGVEQVQLVDRSVAYQASYLRKFPEHASHHVMIVDVGHADTTISVLGPVSSNATSKDDEGAEEDLDSSKKENETPTSAASKVPTMKVLACERHKGLGAGVVDVRLWHHFRSTHPGLKAGATSLTPTSRGGQRLLAGVTKLKHLLSQLPEGKVTVENVGSNDSDITLEAQRGQLVELCAPDAEALTVLVKKALANSGIDAQALSSVEVVGGGCRMPWIKQVLESATQMSTLSYTLDDTSAAMGAALVGEKADAAEGILLRRSATEAVTAAQVSLRANEQAMAAMDQELHLRSATLNQIESHILGLRSAKHERHGELLPAELFAYLDMTEDWLFSPEADDASYEALQSKWHDIQSKTADFSKPYTQALDMERKKKEAEMEAEAQQAQKERDGEEAAGDDEDDHDNRRLPKKRRMEIVLKNKKEGGELFSDGNFKFAAARYAKALSHCAKFVDLGPDDLEEVRGMKLTLNLNLALAYLKMQNPDQALRYANDALALDGQHTKALYRRASILYEKKQWDAAAKDLKCALNTTPDDKALQKLKEKVDAQMKRQKLKEKKMAQKMFG